ncbi:sigma factor-like helix-turn-helix DNA-binding protein [Eggerthella sp.]|uniref:sigma factor-like helix-turn-helix DNA-binding protein n=1 Tax=Eggerthella sp. TaxID=1929886 RepID=UPI00290E2DB5|nr:sigma factor-like helix-turn-helix DNA-binding protein [Eggerthella sp.]MDU5256472.1 sigma factor-like helix-turn-helix DNA-binding protein [Eggerthella sp.]
MELSSSDKERIQHQYDALAKKTLVGEAKSHRRTLAKRAAREVTFSDLSESELAQLFTTDEYESDYFRFQVSGFDVLVKNELLAEALNALPERKRDIILLSYFLDMSDAEIGELLNVVRTTVFRHRKRQPRLAHARQFLGKSFVARCSYLQLNFRGSSKFS